MEKQVPLLELKSQQKNKLRNFKKSVDNKNWGDNIENVAKLSDWKFKGMWKRQKLILREFKNEIELWKLNSWKRYIPVDFEKMKRTHKNEVEQSTSVDDGHKLSDNGEFDPGSGWTLAACFIHASRTRIWSLLQRKVADGWVIHRESALSWGTTVGNDC